VASPHPFDFHAFDQAAFDHQKDGVGGEVSEQSVGARCQDWLRSTCERRKAQKICPWLQYERWGGLMDVNNHGTVKKFPCMLRTFAD
jgi:hypothetical protein